MKAFYKLLNSIKTPPPTRGIRYKQSLHHLVQKNSFRSPLIPFEINRGFQTFTVFWNKDMTYFTLVNTTKHTR